MQNRTGSSVEDRFGLAAARFGGLGLALALSMLPLGCTYFGDRPPSCPDRARANASADPLGTRVAGEPERGRELFGEHCATCHAAERAGRFFLFRGIPRLNCPDYVRTVSPAYLDRVISQGGRSVGESRIMPGFADRLSREEIASLVAYIRASGEPESTQP